MPSRQLIQISKQIEAQNTDNFAKFYMYASLLNTIAVRDKSFMDGLPQYEEWGRGVRPLNIGELPSQFPEQVREYAHGFRDVRPENLKAISTMVLTYFRKGKIADLSYIIEQMLNHLELLHGEQSHNDYIYTGIKFADKKAEIQQLIAEISNFSRQAFSVVDNTGNAILAAAVVGIGIVILFTSLVSLFTLAGGLAFLVGAGLIGTGLFCAYSWGQAVEQEAHRIQDSVKAITKKYENLPRDTSLFGSRNQKAFMNAISNPLPYTAFTVQEQLLTSSDQDLQQQIEQGREVLNIRIKT